MASPAMQGLYDIGSRPTSNIEDSLPSQVTESLEAQGKSYEYIAPKTTVHIAHDKISFVRVERIECLGKAIEEFCSITFNIHRITPWWFSSKWPGEPGSEWVCCGLALCMGDAAR